MEKKTILLADDNNSAIEYFQSRIQPEFVGYAFEFCEDGLALQSRLKENVDGIALVVTDNKMPGINGIEIISKYSRQKKFKNTPFILYTIDDDDFLPDTAKKYGAYACVFKADSEKLILTMREALNGKENI
ncbi:response regulator transcription factor [Candidatus Pacearchaeota archaeon]|nr:response regulator transcription factor [Candidatus Pacearchaeota archaeon]